jgi:uncharacterized protein (DUF1501 family)
MPTTRRSFLAAASMLAAGNALGLKPFGLLNALAQSSSEYKALVCVFMTGGNDANNMLIPFDTKGYQTYSTLRGPLALSQNTLLQLSKQPDFALHPSIPEVQSLFDNGNAAFLANVGTLLQPTTRAEYLANTVTNPGNLFSHPDQQLEWQNQLGTSVGSSGWAGRVADKLTTQYNPGALVPMVASIDGDTLFGNGEQTSSVSVSPNGPTSFICADSPYCGARQQATQQLATMASGVSLVQADNAITTNAANYNSVLNNALNSATALQTVFPTSGNAFAAQLQEVANLIQVRAALGVKRQIFFVMADNFDTHGAQLETQASLLAQVSPALGAFYQALEEMNLTQQVTTFTCSDFGRTYQPNSANGSDHAWGSHHIILGGAVKGGKIYGTMPEVALGGPNDSDVNGRWIPTTSSSQYLATLAQWFGVAKADLPYVLPYIGNFGSNDLGFV